MKYPPYACSCCGYTNADMYYDWAKTQNQAYKKYKESVE